MIKIGAVPTYTTEQIHVYEDDGDVILQIVGERGGIKAAARLADYGVQQLDRLTHKALLGPPDERAEWLTHSRLDKEIHAPAKPLVTENVATGEKGEL
jgi:hypothetical protein